MSDASSTVSMRASGGGGRCKGCGTDHEPGSPSCPMSRIGTMLAGRYRLERLIGFGGMGAVYGAENISLGRKVAIKVLHPAMAARPDVVDRFRREARSVAGLRHDGFAHVYALDTDERGQFFIEMELLEGDPVDRLIANGPVPIDRCIAIIESALEALAVAHAAGLVHRDLKPENLFVRTDGKVKVLDFGIARVSDEARRLTGSGQFMGTLTYASVEQLRDASTVDARSDVYSFGATAFELVTGANVCGRGSYADVITRIMTDKIERSIRARRSDAPEWLDALIARTLAMNPADRFTDARELLVALRASRGPAQLKARTSRAPILIALAILVAGGAVATVLLTRPKETASHMATAIDAMAADAMAADAMVIDATTIDAAIIDARATVPPRDATARLDAASTKTAEQLNDEGKELIYAGRYAEAAAVYKQLVRVAPIAKYYFNLCTALYSNGEYDAATQACTTGLAKNPDAVLKEKFQKLLERIAGSR
jgi:tetratricopeptide (TPR) repeat protein